MQSYEAFRQRYRHDAGDAVVHALRCAPFVSHGELLTAIVDKGEVPELWARELRNELVGAMAGAGFISPRRKHQRPSRANPEGITVLWRLRDDRPAIDWVCAIDGFFTRGEQA